MAVLKRHRPHYHSSVSLQNSSQQLTEPSSHLLIMEKETSICWGGVQLLLEASCKMQDTIQKARG